MSKKCDICGKKPMGGNHVSHAHNLTKRKFNPNLQTVKSKGKKRQKVCTSCIQAGHAIKVA